MNLTSSRLTWNLLAYLSLVTTPLIAQPPTVDNVILITLDGARTQEIFGGLDIDVLQSSSNNVPVETTAVYQQYWASTPEARRRQLMPFFWGTLMADYGSIAGNRTRGSVVELTNTQRFSYPGYSEMLTGESHDDVITSNENRRYSFPTVLDFLKNEMSLDRERVAVFAAWETFRWIVSNKVDTFTVNAGYQSSGDPNPTIQTLTNQQFETLTPWDSVRHDFYTFRLAMAHLAAYKPRVLYLALGETDDWAHNGRYDRTLQALNQFDDYLQELWEWLEADSQYRNRTGIIITVDHGRGNTAADWTDHGNATEGAQYIWMAFVSPTVSLRGEWSDHEPIRQNQVAATLAHFLGFNFRTQTPTAGPPIETLFVQEH